MRARLRKSLSSPNLASEMMEVQALLRDGPRKLSDILSLVAENRFQMRVTGLEESRLMENLQKIANRISVGVITAALILASAMMMRVPSSHTLWGYPVVALVLFLLGVALGEASSPARCSATIVRGRARSADHASAAAISPWGHP